MEKEEIKTIVVIDGVNRNRRIYSPKTFEARVKRVRWCNSYSEQLQTLLEHNEVYGAKWTDNGLIYTHKLNAKGEFEPIEAKNEQELKVLQILKEKKVDIKFISTLIHKATEVWKVELKSAIMEFTIRYNVGKNIPLTIEEMALIVEWLKEV